MPVFISCDLHALHTTYATLQSRLEALATAYASHPYKTEAGLQYATHGFLRRFSLMHRERKRGFRATRNLVLSDLGDR
jgi:hypothetical protein